jgi:hypothetical protein
MEVERKEKGKAAQSGKGRPKKSKVLVDEIEKEGALLR